MMSMTSLRHIDEGGVLEILKKNKKEIQFMTSLGPR